MHPIAIIGIGCRLPGGVADAVGYWGMLSRGECALGEIPPDRWALAGFYDPMPDRPDRSYSKWGGFLADIRRFDAERHGLSQREAAAMDPQQRLLLDVASEAVADARLPMAALRRRQVGVYVGVSNGDYGLLQRFRAAHGEIQAGTGTALSIVANRLSNVLDLSGPSLAVDTACSSALVAVDAAVRALADGSADLALAGGVNVLLDPRMFITFCRAHMLSPRGRIAAFDAAADGFVRGEGAGLVLLKRLADALADGDPIRAVIRATMVNQDGGTDTLTAPDPGAQKAMLRELLERGAAKPADVAFAEAHGTGTAVGDPIEAEALGEVIGRLRDDGSLLIGSVKTNIGHLEPAAGIAGLIKAVLALEHGRLPPSLGYATPNPAIPFDALNLAVAARLTPLPAGLGLVNAFGFGGTNASVLIERAPLSRPPPLPRGEGRRAVVALALSAATPAHLAAEARVLADALDRGGLAGTDLTQVAAALAIQRDGLAHRAVVLAENVSEAVARLRSLTEGVPPPPPTKGLAACVHVDKARPRGRLVFTCTGQGGQFWNMGRELLECDPDFRGFVARFDREFAPRAGWSVLRALSAGEGDSRLGDPAVTPAAMFALQGGLAEVWKAAGVEPDMVIGHSFGEVTAAYLGGAIALADVAHLVNHRGLIRRHIDRVGGMAAIGMGADDLAAFLPADGSLEIGAYNSPSMVTVSGERASIDRLIERIGRHDPAVRTLVLDLDFAWHSSWLEPARGHFLAAVGVQPWQATRIPVISTVTGIPEARFDTAYWWRNLREPVRFDRAVATALEMGADTFVELGPTRTLSSPTAGVATALGKRVQTVASLQRGEQDATALAAAKAELWVSGRPVCLVRDASRNGRRVALPPCARLEAELWQEPEEARTLLRGRMPHPLLGERIPGPSPAWQGEIGLATHGWLADHRIGGDVVLPAAGLIEMLSAAGQEAIGATAVELRHVRLVELLTIGADDIVQLRTEYDTERRRLRIWSRKRDGGSDWTLRAEAGLAAAPDVLPPTAPSGVGPAGPLAGSDQFYRDCEALGYGYGPAFRVIVRIDADDTGRACAELRAPAEGIAAAEGMRLDPRLLDGALQVVMAALAGEAPVRGCRLLPESLGRLRVHGAIAGTAMSECVLRERDARKARFDVRIRNPSGRLLADIVGLEVRLLDAPDADAGAAALAPGFLVERYDEWSPAPGGSPVPEGVHLVLAGMGCRRAPALAAGLARRGARVRALAIDAARGGPGGAFQAALAEFAPGSVAAIVYALPLAAPGGPAGSLPDYDEVERASASLLAFGRALERTAGWSEPPPVRVLTAGARALPGEAGPAAAGLAGRALWGLARTLAIELPSCRLSLIDCDEAALACPQALVSLLLESGGEREAIVRGLRVLVPRLVRARLDEIPPRTVAAQHVPAGRSIVLRQRSRGIEGLVWQETAIREPGPGEVRVRVHAAGLNFRDVMAVSGLLPTGAEPTEPTEALGLELCGVVETVGLACEGRPLRLTPGERVYGMARGSLARVVTVSAEGLCRAPDHLSDAEAAGQPAALLTAHYALTRLAHLERRERILIHSAAGGLGLAAVALARRTGAEILATAGSEEKREYLRALGVAHVFDSRSVAFTDGVLAATGGRGVDVVLNALAGPFIEAGLACLAPYGRFIELGKRDLHADSPIGLGALRRNISLHVADVAALVAERPALARTLLEEVTALIEAREIRPLPVTAFDAEEARAAFARLASGRHSGKVAVRLAGAATPVAMQRSGWRASAAASYLVTGGNSGFGLAIARRLAGAGAGRVVLASRSAHFGLDIDAVMAEARAKGCTVEAVALDVTDSRAVARLVGRLAAEPLPLRGIVHAATGYADALIGSMSRDRLAAALAPKVAGAINLTRAVQASGVRLDFFLSLSSLAQVIGWAGQANYAAANAFLEGLAEAQRASGIPGFCVNLGMLSHSGHVARSGATRQYLESAGWLPLSDQAALDAIAFALDSATAGMTFAAADWRRLGARVPVLAAAPRLASLVAADTAVSGCGLLRTIRSVDLAEARAAALGVVVGELARVLHHDRKSIGTDTPLSVLGIDSLSSFELRNRIEAAAGVPVPLGRFAGAKSAEALAELLLALAREAHSPGGDKAADLGPNGAAPAPSGADLLPFERLALRLPGARMTSDRGRDALTIAAAMHVAGAHSREQIAAAWQQVADRHDTLRMIVVGDRLEVSGRPAAAAIGAPRPDDGPTPHLCRLSVEIDGNGAARRLVLSASPAALDHAAATAALAELSALLNGRGTGSDAPATSWQSLRRMELGEHEEPRRTHHLAYWRTVLRDAPAAIRFEHRVRALAPVGLGQNRGAARRLRTVVRPVPDREPDAGAALAAFGRALVAATGGPDIVVSVELRRRGEGRETVVAPLARQVLLVVRTAEADPADLARRVRRDLAHAERHAAFDLAALAEELGPEWLRRGVVPGQVGFVWQERMIGAAPVRSAIAHDMLLVARPGAGGLVLDLHYDQDAGIAAMAGPVLDGVKAVLSAPAPGRGTEARRA